MRVTGNTRVVDTTLLQSPEQALRETPISEIAADFITQARDEIAGVVQGRDRRLLAIVGPCSIHDPQAALEYAGLLLKLRHELSNELLICMRVYFEKPRTTVGWKGLINDPELDGISDIPSGIRRGRALLRDVAELGLPAATELLDPIIPAYIADLISWSAIGARTTESQTHREMASGLSMPVGFKNGTDGSLGVAVNGIVAASRPHSFLGVAMDGRVGVVKTSGNPHAHLVLRGGGRGPNYDAASVEQARVALERAGVNSRVLVDLSHDNSGKDFSKQPGVLREVGEQVRGGNETILGVMIESHLVAGRQDHEPGKPLVYGQSITDGCVDFSTTAAMLRALARDVAAARR